MKLQQLSQHLRTAINSRLFLLVFLGVVTWIIAHKSDHYYHWFHPEDKQQTVFRSDGFGYYSFLPQYFIYFNHPGYTYLDSLKQHGVKFSDNSISNHSSGQKIINKYYIGTALFYSPFFFSDLAIQKMRGTSVNGYSYSFQLSIFIGAMLYVFLSMLLLVRIFEQFKLSRLFAFCCILLLYFGTNLAYYAYNEFAMSHFPAFFCCTLLIYLVKKWEASNASKHLVFSALVAALLILIRPTDGLFLGCIPFSFSSFTAFKARLAGLFQLKNTILLVGTVVLVGIVFFLQFLSNYYQTGDFFSYLYQNEGLSNVGSPEIFNVLFSYKKGFFVYTPVMLLLIPSWVILWRKKRYFGFGSFALSFLFLWITASWWMWYYGGSFGMRPFIDWYPLFGLVIFMAFSQISSLWKWGYIVLVVCGIYVNQIYEKQYYHGIIHYSEMNKAFFWHVFLKTDSRFNWYPFLQLDNQKHKEKGKLIKQHNYSLLTSSKNSIVLPDKRTVLHYTLDSNYYCGVHLHGKEKIFKAYDRNSVAFVFLKNEQSLDSINLMIGNKITKLNDFQSFNIEYMPPIQQKADSLIVYLIPHYNTRRIIKNGCLTIDYLIRDSIPSPTK